jgi:hypothetical protein
LVVGVFSDGGGQNANLIADFLEDAEAALAHRCVVAPIAGGGAQFLGRVEELAAAAGAIVRIARNGREQRRVAFGDAAPLGVIAFSLPTGWRRIVALASNQAKRCNVSRSPP